MYNPDHQGLTGNSAGGAPIGPRISFSSDFVEAHTHGNIIKQERSKRDLGPISTDFEFSVSAYSMMTADELFSKGKWLPLKQRAASSSNSGTGTATSSTTTTTLRDELLDDDDDDDVHIEDNGGGFSLKPPKGATTTRWKGFLGLRKSHNGSKKPEKNDGFTMERSSAVEAKRSTFPFGHPPNVRKSSQEMIMSDEGSNDMDLKTWSQR